MGKKLDEMTKEELWELFPIVLKKHNNEYKQWYLLEKGEIIYAVGYHNIRRISHIGSTSIEGLLAKPTVDILLELEGNCNMTQLEKNLKCEGWLLMNKEEKPQFELLFCKGYTEKGFAEKVFHLHVRYAGDWNELYFRDYLKQNQAVAMEYADLKTKLSKKYKHDRDAYTNAKGDFISKYTEIARTQMGTKYLPKGHRTMVK